MSIEESIANKIKKSLAPSLLELENESHMHSGPRKESHFKALVVSNVFEGVSRVERQRKVYDLLKKEFESGLHALTMRLLTPAEYKKKAQSFSSPECSSKKINIT